MNQATEVILTNLGFVVIAFLFCRKNMIASWEDERKLASLSGNLTLIDYSAEFFLNNCQYYNLTPREIEIVPLMRLGQKHKTIADDLFISEATVKKRAQNIYKKTNFTNKYDLITKLERQNPEL